ncbi:hypothetical protein HK104_009910 [Borealophlyctis nickersoniae]|nr:hypothetical protein HK104_009910 [Borealophlyctis nickersoniae]
MSRGMPVTFHILDHNPQQASQWDRTLTHFTEVVHGVVDQHQDGGMCTLRVSLSAGGPPCLIAIVKRVETMWAIRREIGESFDGMRVHVESGAVERMMNVGGADATTDDESQIASPKSCYYGKLPLGCAIGPHQAAATETEGSLGTLGGFLQSGSGEGFYGLTAGHVVKLNAHVDQPPALIRGANITDARVQPNDYADVVVQRYESKPPERWIISSSPVSADERVVGRFAFNGAPEMHIDYGFFQIDGARRMVAQPPNGRLFQTKSRSERGILQIIPKPSVISKVELYSMVSPMRVYKVGARSGTTEGFLLPPQHPRATCRLEDESSLEPIPTLTVLVAPTASRTLAGGYYHEFAAPGDSGALVMEMGTNRAVGIIMAGEEKGRVCFLTPLYLIFEHSQHTGKDMEWA